MFLLHEPTPSEVDAFIEKERDLPYTYREVGASRGAPPAPEGYLLHQSRMVLGSGGLTYAAAVEAIRRWRMYDLSWTRLYSSGSSDCTVALLVRSFGFWSLNAMRVVYQIEEEAGDLRRGGFAIGTLPEHAVSGEERFMIEWNRADDLVHYDLLSFSRPHQLLAKLGYPLARILQRRFAGESAEAILRS